ncbi:hypothetical protein P43SY_009398 [Pythium insidiosum]|uniref:FYVE-type domain-containing protein n=1 Tax=Pythium insidiosum TaxID=114742 RepID=A0AAD5Q6T0_PYTIN|nr:hypothetical protein P43SY_009398 [Pythium insidiosum]
MRSPFAPLELSAFEDAQLEHLATTLVEDFLDEHDRFHLLTEIDVQRQWRLVQTRKNISVYRRRWASHERHQDLDQEPPQLLARGFINADLDDVMYASVAPSNDTSRVKLAAMGGNEIAGSLLHTVTPPTPQSPFRSTSIKWMVRCRSSRLDSVVRKRDFVLLEATGVLTRARGDRVGYHLSHSVEFAQTPELTRRSIVRAKASFCQFFKEVAPSKVEVWGTGTIDLRGGVWPSVALNVAARMVLAICDLPEFALTKKLAYVLECRRRLEADAISCLESRPSTSTHAAVCAICHAAPSPILRWRRLLRCHVCDARCCSKCVTSATVFHLQSDRQHVQRETLRCCVSCLTIAQDENAFLVASQELQVPRFSSSIRSPRESTLDDMASVSQSAEPENDDASDASPRDGSGGSRRPSCARSTQQSARRLVQLFSPSSLAKQQLGRVRACSTESSSTLSCSVSTLSCTSTTVASLSVRRRPSDDEKPVDVGIARAQEDGDVDEELASILDSDRPWHSTSAATGPAASTRPMRRFNFFEAMARLQAVADATYLEQRQLNAEMDALNRRRMR